MNYIKLRFWHKKEASKRKKLLVVLCCCVFLSLSLCLKESFLSPGLKNMLIKLCFSLKWALHCFYFQELLNLTIYFISWKLSRKIQNLVWKSSGSFLRNFFVLLSFLCFDELFVYWWAFCVLFCWAFWIFLLSFLSFSLLSFLNFFCWAFCVCLAEENTKICLKIYCIKFLKSSLIALN